MKKIGIYTLRIMCMAFIGAVALAVMFATALVLGDAIPEGTNAWVRTLIGVPCIIIAPVSVELLLIAIIRKIDRKHLVMIH